MLNDISPDTDDPLKAAIGEQPIEKTTIVYKDFEPPTGFRGKKIAKNDVLLK